MESGLVILLSQAYWHESPHNKRRRSGKHAPYARMLAADARRFEGFNAEQQKDRALSKGSFAT